MKGEHKFPTLTSVWTVSASRRRMGVGNLSKASGQQTARAFAV